MTSSSRRHHYTLDTSFLCSSSNSSRTDTQRQWTAHIRRAWTSGRARTQHLATMYVCSISSHEAVCSRGGAGQLTTRLTGLFGDRMVSHHIWKRVRMPLWAAFLVHSTTRCTLHNVCRSAVHITGAFVLSLVHVCLGAKPFPAERDERCIKQVSLVDDQVHWYRPFTQIFAV